MRILHKYLEECGEWVEETNGDKYYLFSKKSSPYFNTVFRHLYSQSHTFSLKRKFLSEEEDNRKLIIVFSKKNKNYLVRMVGLSKTKYGTYEMMDFGKLYDNSDNFVKRFKEVYGCN